MKTYEINDVRVAEPAAEGERLATERDATDLIGELYGSDANVVAIPTQRLSPEFFQLRTTLAGLFIEKIQNYGFRLAIVGDLSAEIAASTALGDFIHESNRRGQVLFVRDNTELAERL